MERDAYVGLGANLDRREEAVLVALRHLAADASVEVLDCSSLYETDAVDMGDAAPFINAVVRIRALLSPEDLLNRLKTIEKRMGRRGGHLAPREIDLDLVVCGDALVETPDLTLPHPRYRERAFVLVPLREIAPDFVCPRSGRGVDELIASLGRIEGVARVSGRVLIPRTTP